MNNRMELIFISFCTIFASMLTICNLMCQKFFQLNFFGLYTFEISVAMIPYPLTFLITDVVSEVYGKKKAEMVVFGGIIASLVSVVVVAIADYVPQTSWSPVDDATFHNVFQVYHVAMGASLLASFVAQFIDIRIFHFWKDYTNGRHLWLRNNCSTMSSQIIDTFIVNFMLSCSGLLSWDLLMPVILASVTIKVIFAFLDTPFFYIGVFLLNAAKKPKFKLRFEKGILLGNQGDWYAPISQPTA